MSLIKKSDVQDHLAAKRTSIYPFGLKRPDAKPAGEGKNPGAPAEVVDISVSPSHPINSEAVPNAQVGGSVGVPEKSGKGSW